MWDFLYIQLMYKKEVAICTMTSFLGGGDQEIERRGSDIRFIMTGGRDRLEVGLDPLTAQYSLPAGGTTSIPALSCRCWERSEVYEVNG